VGIHLWADARGPLLIFDRKFAMVENTFSNTEIVTIAVYLLGGASNYVDTEDIAVKVDELAPGRFTWRKYSDQINIDNVRKRLSDAKNPKKGGIQLEFIIGL